MKRQSITLIGTALLTLAGCGQPNNSVLLERGNYAMWQGRWADAAADFDKAVSQHPGDWNAQYSLGQCLLKTGQAQEAAQALAVAESLRPSNTDIADSYAEALLMAGEPDQLFSFLQSRAQKRQTLRAWTRFAEYAMDLDDPDSATNAINTAIAISDGSDATPYITAATFSERLGDDSLAVSYWRKAWNINPHDENVANALRAHGVVPGPTMSGITDDSQ